MHKKGDILYLPFCCVCSHLQIHVSTFLIIGCMGNYYASLPAIGDSLAIATRDSRNNQSRRPVDGGCDTRHFLFRDSSQAEQVFCSYLNGKWWSAAWRVSVPAVLHLIAFGFIWRKPSHTGYGPRKENTWWQWPLHLILGSAMALRNCQEKPLIMTRATDGQDAASVAF